MHNVCLIPTPTNICCGFMWSYRQEIFHSRKVQFSSMVSIWFFFFFLLLNIFELLKGKQTTKCGLFPKMANYPFIEWSEVSPTTWNEFINLSLCIFTWQLLTQLSVSHTCSAMWSYVHFNSSKACYKTCWNMEHSTILSSVSENGNIL